MQALACEARHASAWMRGQACKRLKEGYGSNQPVINMLFNSAVMALGITFGKLTISLLSAFAIVYFRFPFRKTCFWLIFITLMLPVEVRIVPTYEVVAKTSPLIMIRGAGGSPRLRWR